ncbi:glycine cleavage system aminomethyltransferase GcvT [Gorillibacterium timonense]|uniref:glycine cleavage system aminomethyltransferase GcvT n=1 Tax=Gorillibacterium timonense TaxID=1689269 RepID=UPI00071E00C8|nr:glycine cleavage system aminomethyltransferase GcvT [Gorillibacterium timonense]
MSALKQTPLYPLYSAVEGARCIDFGGWELPVQFSGIQAEHDAVRDRAGLFDVSHMGEVYVSGKDAEAYLQKLTVNDVTRLADGAAQYSLMCYPDGGTVDDLLVYKLNAEAFLLVLNASNLEKDIEWLTRHLEGDVTLNDQSDRTALLALQGPLAELILTKLAAEPDRVRALKPFTFLAETEVAGVKLLLSRTGYTGEDGFELYVPAEQAGALWTRLLEVGEPEGLVPVGLGARDTLRFEAGLALYGQELSATISPLEAGLARWVKLDKGDFIGREALLRQKEQGVPRKLVGIEMIDRGIPRSHYPLYAIGEPIGEVTTGTRSPSLKRDLGLALVKAEYAELGTEIEIEIRGKRLKAVVIAAPFYKRIRKEKAK